MHAGPSYGSFFRRMKGIFKSFLFSLIALFGAAKLIGGFSFSDDPAALILAAIILGAVNLFIKPLLKLVTLPLNLITLGSFSLLLNTALLYFIVQIVPGLLAEAFLFPGFEVSTRYLSLSVPSFAVPALGTVFLTSIVISFFLVSLRMIFGD